MSREKQNKKVSKERQEYLKFKPFADDLRKAESWCELDGVLNRYQTVKNLSKMGYRKQSEGEWIESDIPQEKYVCSLCGGACWYYDYQGDVAKSRFCPNCGAKMKGGASDGKQNN